MSTFKLNGQEIPFEPGDTIIRAAWRQGIEIPHYCWHPGLSVAANCRMCLVDVKSQRPVMLPIVKWDAQKQQYVDTLKTKLVPACQQAVTEGMEVASDSPEVKEAQKSTQEFLLLNHPVDCPICDQAGECKLQDYWLENQHELKRKHTEPVHKSKGVRFGPTIVYDGERCVMCTRCIRFNDEVAKEPVLDMRERGNVNEIVLSAGKELDHKYSLMNEHVCPVGALTSRDFRFKARVWFLKTQPSVCGGCATGCSTLVDFDPRDQQVKRLRPRDNEKVNQYWMCDDGMLSYHDYHQGRAVTGRVRVGTTLETVTSSQALDEAAKLLAAVQAGGQRAGVVLSAHHATEDNFVVAKLARDVLGTDKLYLAAKAAWDGDAILRSADQSPNRAGATAVAGGAFGTVKDLVKDVEAGAVKVVLVLGSHTAEHGDALAPLAKVPMIVLATHETGLGRLAAIVVPVAVHVEMNGTFTNAKGVAQTFKRAVSPPPGVRPAWETAIDLARKMGTGAKGAPVGAGSFVSSFEDVRKALPQQASEARA